jgi:hypothetical protein
VTKPKAVTEPKPDPREQCRGRVRYPALDGAQVAAKVLRGIGRPVGDPKRCAVCSGYHLPAQKQQRARGRAA